MKIVSKYSIALALLAAISAGTVNAESVYIEDADGNKAVVDHEGNMVAEHEDGTVVVADKHGNTFRSVIPG